MTTASVLDPRTIARNAFAGFIGNEDAVYVLTRDMALALDRTPPVLDQAYMFVGPPSSGKTELAERVARGMGLPDVQMDGGAPKTREAVFESIDAALADKDMRAKPINRESGMDAYEYPPFVLFIDEAQELLSSVSEALLTMISPSGRRVVVKRDGSRVVARVPHATFIFATTEVSRLSGAFRSRCHDLLREYSDQEVALMVRDRFGHLPDGIALKLARLGRMTPRRALGLAKQLDKEIRYAGCDWRDGIATIKRTNGILYDIGLTGHDLRYLDILRRANKPVSENNIVATLADLDPKMIRRDVEHYLIRQGFVATGEKGRSLTRRGWQLLEQLREEK